jgi:hypothetical protein
MEGGIGAGFMPGERSLPAASMQEADGWDKPAVATPCDFPAKCARYFFGARNAVSALTSSCLPSKSAASRE